MAGWEAVMRGRRNRRVAAGFGALVAAAVATGWALAPMAQAADTTISYSGDTVSLSPIPGVCAITFELAGADGGNSGDVGTFGTIFGGDGGAVSGTVGVKSGDVVAITVGGVGADDSAGGAGGFNGGGNGATGGSAHGAGGGGATTVTVNGIVVLVAGGGGGVGGSNAQQNGGFGGEGAFGVGSGDDGFPTQSQQNEGQGGLGGTLAAGGA